MKQLTLPTPPLWLLTLIVGLPQIAETIYTPALPDIAKSLAVSESFVEYTLSIYLFGFAVGTLFWGKISDYAGRKLPFLISMVIYLAGCIGCFYSSSITLLMISRFVQAFGGSTGSVLGQAMCRDAFHGHERGKVYSTIGSVLAFSPAIGPVIGGLIDQAFGWSSLFLLLTLLGTLVLLISVWYLPETHPHESRSHVSLGSLFWKLASDIRVLAFGVLVAGCNGIQFSYFAEGSFYLIELLGLSPTTYGLTFIALACAGMFGGWLSRILHNHQTSLHILWLGIYISVIGAFLFMMLTLLFNSLTVPASVSIALTLTSMMALMMGNAIIIPNALSLALDQYRYAVGAASALFGSFYYLLISACTMLMGMLHNGTLLPMPLYFFSITIIMLIAAVIVTNKEPHATQ